MKAKTLCLLVAILFGFSSAGYAQVKEYPNKPIQIIVGHAAGSAIDIFYRMIADEVGKTWKVPVNAINKTGASGSVGANEVATSPKDGYTFFGTLVGQLVALSVANPKSPVHILRDFDPVELHTYAASVMYVRADSPFKTFDDVVDYARKKPGELLCGVSQIGSNSHLEALLLNRLAKVDITLINQEGPPEIMTRVLGGHFAIGWGNHIGVMPQVTAGKVRPLISDIKSPFGIPTFADKGYSQIDLVSVTGLFGPKGLPPTVIKAWDDALAKAMKDPGMQASLTKQGYVVNMTTGTEKLNKMVKEEVARYSRFTPEELGWKK